MSDIITKAVEVLNEKFSGSDFSGTVKFIIENEGTIIADCNGARASDEEADVVMTATAETFQDLIKGELNPTSAFMGGKLSIDGDMGLAMKLAATL